MLGAGWVSTKKRQQEAPTGDISLTSTGWLLLLPASLLWKGFPECFVAFWILFFSFSIICCFSETTKKKRLKNRMKPLKDNSSRTRRRYLEKREGTVSAVISPSSELSLRNALARIYDREY